MDIQNETFHFVNTIFPLLYFSNKQQGKWRIIIAAALDNSKEEPRVISNHACFSKKAFFLDHRGNLVYELRFQRRNSWYFGIFPRAGNKTVFLAETRGCVLRLPVHTFDSFVSFSIRVPNVERITKRKQPQMTMARVAY